MEQKKKTFVIIDGNAIIHRAYHAVPPLSTKDGVLVNAVYGFTSMLLKVLSDIKPDYIAVSFDLAGPTFRDEIFTEYKATRVAAEQSLYDQIPLVHDMVRALNIPIFVKQGYEADDVIGTIVEQNKQHKKSIQNIIVTGDRDLLQLVDDEVAEVYLLKKGIGDFELYNDEKVKEYFGFGPEMVVDYKALRGDSSDNIPGVKGIGEKTATILITQIGGIDAIYQLLEKDPEKMGTICSKSVIQKLVDGKENAYMSKRLAAIECAVPETKIDLSVCAIDQLKWDSIAEELRKYDFFSLIKRIPGLETTKSEEIKKEKTNKSKTLSVSIVKTKEGILEMIAEIKKVRRYCVKEIISGKDVIDGEWIGLAIVVDGSGYYIDVGAIGENGKKALLTLFDDKKIILLGHDIKQLLRVLALHGFVVSNTLFDIMIASYVLNASTRAHDLSSIVLRELGIAVSAADQGSLFGRDPKQLVQELAHIPAIFERYDARLKEDKQETVFDTIEMKVLPVLAAMENAGIAVDTSVLGDLSVEVAKNIAAVSKKIFTEAGQEFNISSSLQLRDILFDTLALPTQGIKKGKTGLSTAAPELEKLRELHPIIALIEEYRELEKLRNTYIDVLPTLIHQKTGRIHTTFNQAVAATGRLSSSDPNLQNIPIRTELGKEIRNTFIAEKGNVLISADYSQIELRVVASLADDKKLIKIFQEGKDVHTATAAIIHGIPEKEVTKEIRRTAKEVNFGVLYGMGSFGLASRTGITQGEAREFIKNYFAQFSGVKTFLENVLVQARERGYVETFFGRRRYVPELLADNKQLQNAGERMAINMPVQGTAADIMKLAMIDVHTYLSKEYTQEEARLILQVHDEVVLEVKSGLEEKISEKIKQIMEEVVELAVPLTTEVHIGTRWGEMK